MAFEMYFDRMGSPLGLFQWARLIENNEYKIIGRTVIGKCLVSTVWVGLNQHWGSLPYHIFETMVFREGGEIYNDFQERYSTQGEAVRGHLTICAVLDTQQLKLEA